jgi:sulfide:quinone oxidoreductase
MSKTHHSIVIVGGGTGGITVASQLLAHANGHTPDVAIIEPSQKHYYQPLWTLVGAGVFGREQAERNQVDVIPPPTTWIRDAVASFDPKNNLVRTHSGNFITYNYLVVAAGLQLNWSKVRGLQGQLGKDGICSNYSHQTVEHTWETLRGLQSGQAVFTHPNTPVKCGGAPMKIMFLTEHYLQREGRRQAVNIHLYKAEKNIFTIKKYGDALTRICDRRDLTRHMNMNLEEVRPGSKEAIFRDIENGREEVVRYDMLHVTPPMGPPDFIKSSPLADAKGWVDVDKHSLQHTRFSNIFALGDVSNLPTSKTGAAIRKQAPVLVENMKAVMAGKRPTESYDGYTSCPLITGYGRLILAEFDYAHECKESFPFDQGRERYSMYALKAYALPQIYWNGMLQGRF